jgi:hypothetical protein
MILGRNKITRHCLRVRYYSKKVKILFLARRVSQDGYLHPLSMHYTYRIRKHSPQNLEQYKETRLEVIDHTQH